MADPKTRERGERIAVFCRRCDTLQIGETISEPTLLLGGHPMEATRDCVIGLFFHASGWVADDREIPTQPTEPQIGNCFAADDAEWTEAVARQGVRIPGADEYYQSTHWQILKQELLEGRCTKCREHVSTTLHHWTYERFGHEKPEDLIELCRKCHARYHDGLRRAA
jgi:hypothetical protein